jgi:multidrug efflux pump subunit AcrA (membrane-fusion protein)
MLPAYDTVAALALIDRPTNNSRNNLHERRVQFASAESALKAGVQVNVASEQPMRETILVNGEIQFDPTRVAHLSPRSGGTVVQVFKIVGDHVQAGDVLALVDVAAVGQAKSELLQAIVNRRLRQSTLDRVEAAGVGVAGSVVVEAKSALSEAEVRVISARQALVNLGFEVPEEIEQEDARRIADDLRFLGIPGQIVAALPAGTWSANLYAVRSPFEGMVVTSESVVGEVVTAADVLYTVADPRRMWLTLAVPQEDAKYVKRGLPVDFRTDNGGQEVRGEVSWVGPTIDPRTRTLEARVVLDNRDERFKDKAFGSGQIVLREESRAVAVPRSAVQTTADANFVFVRDKNYLQQDAPKVFHVRQVRTGAADEKAIEILAGVLPGEVVATEGSNVILSQLLRSNLGAGCGCHEPAANAAKKVAAK